MVGVTPSGIIHLIGMELLRGKIPGSRLVICYGLVVWHCLVHYGLVRSGLVVSHEVGIGTSSGVVNGTVALLLRE